MNAPHQPTKSGTFWDHVDELRAVIIRLLLVWILFAVGYFVCMDWMFDVVIMGPCHADFLFYQCIRFISESIGVAENALMYPPEINLINYNLTSPFLIHISTAFGLAVLTTVPYLFYEIWRFIRPALYPKEKRGVMRAFWLGGGMFYIGALVGYFLVFPLTLRFLIGYQLSESITNQLSLTSYMDNFTGLIAALGITFEIPLLLWILGIFGLIHRQMLKTYRRHAFLAVVILAAVITPTGDPFTLTIVALPLWLLYELSICMVPIQVVEQD